MLPPRLAALLIVLNGRSGDVRWQVGGVYLSINGLLASILVVRLEVLRDERWEEKISFKSIQENLSH